MNKTKFFSSLLVAALFATTSVFTSCKDYDDDIKNLQTQIDQKAVTSELTALQSQLATISANATKAAQDAEAALKAANAAQTTASAAVTTAQLDEAINAVKKTAEKAGTDAAAAMQAATTAGTDASAAAEAAKKAQETADQAVKDAAAAATKELPADVQQAVKDIASLQQNAVTTDNLKQQLVDLGIKIEQGESDGEEVGKYKAMIDELYAAVTSVSLYVSTPAANVAGHNAQNLIFAYATEKTTKFPLDADKAMADKQYEFTDGVNATLDKEILIRVSPASAKLTEKNVTLMNSLGEAFNNPELVSVKAVEPYEELLTRAAGEAKGGLWKVTFQLKKGFNEDALDAATKSNKKSIAFAVAVNNTLTNAADRYAVSEYDVLVGAGPAVPAYNFLVNETPVYNIHNRWERCETDGTYTNQDLANGRGKLVQERNWKAYTSQYPTPSIGENAKDDNYSGDRINGLNGYDNRQWQQILSVVKGETIEIEFPNELEALRGFYVTLDSDFALESTPSEINAWTSYEYENVGYKKADGTIVAAKMQDGNKGSITIKDMNNVKGDIIGFRVYAVNLDGTLTDPDGRAFYVKVGDVASVKTLETVEVTIQENSKSVKEFNLPANFAFEALSYQLTWGENNPMINISGANSQLYTPVSETANQYEPQTTTAPIVRGGIFNLNNGGSVIDIEFYDNNRADWYQLNNIINNGTVDQITKGRVVINQANALLDGKTYNLVLSGFSTTAANYSAGATEAIEIINIAVTKVMPTEMPEGLAKKQGQLANNLLTVYMKPWNDDWTITNKANYPYTGKFYGKDIYPYDLADIFNGLQHSSVTDDGQVIYNYSWKFNNSDKNREDNKLMATESEMGNTRINIINGGGSSVSLGGSYFVPYAEESVVGDGEKKAVDAQYTYPNISLATKRNVGTTTYLADVDDWTVTKEKFFEVEYVCALNHAADVFAAKASTDAEKAKFTANYEDNTKDIDLANTTYKAITLPSNIAKSNIGIDDATYKTMADFIAADIIQIKEATLDCDYFEVASWTPAGVITLKKTRSSEKPNLTSDQTYQIKVKYVDVFGHERTVNIPFYMKKPVATAPRH